MALTDLTGTEWLFNDVLDCEENITYYLNFQSNNEDFIQLRLYNDSNYPNEMWYRISSSTASKYVYENGWSLPLYKTITITGGASATNSNLITWLKANAIWINQPEGVFVSYSGSEIATMEESGTKTLLTSGKYCESDIIVEYNAVIDGDNLSYGSNTSNYVNAGAADYMII